MRAGYRSRTSTPRVHDEGALRLSETMRTKFYYGRTMTRYMGKHPHAARTIFRPAFLRHADLLRAHPVRATGMFFMKACEIGAGAPGAGVSLLGSGRR
jgi:hypothetical protein